MLGNRIILQLMYITLLLVQHSVKLMLLTTCISFPTKCITHTLLVLIQDSKQAIISN